MALPLLFSKRGLRRHRPSHVNCGDLEAVALALDLRDLRKSFSKRTRFRRGSNRRLGVPESVQPELAVDRANFGRLDQARMRHGDRVQRAFELFQPKVQELIQVREHRAEIVILPDVGL